MQVNSAGYYPYSFKAKSNVNQSKNSDINPISKNGEKALLVKSAFAAGAAMAGKFLLLI